MREISEGYCHAKNVIGKHIILGSGHVLFCENPDQFLIAIHAERFLSPRQIDREIPHAFNYVHFFLLDDLLPSGLSENDKNFIRRYLDIASDQLYDSLHKDYQGNVFERIHLSVGNLYPEFLILFVQLSPSRIYPHDHEKEIVFGHLQETIKEIIACLLRYSTMIIGRMNSGRVGFGFQFQFQFNNETRDLIALVELKLCEYRGTLLKKLYGYL